MPAQLGDVSRSRLVLGGLLAVALATRLPAYLGGLYGEQDTARLVVDALAWVEAGVRNETLSEYRYYTSPGYIALIAGLVPVVKGWEVNLGQILGLLNLLLGVAIVVPAYRLASRLTDRRTAGLAVLAMLFMPMMWHAATYGFPHLPSAFCLLGALLLYDRHLTGPPWLGKRGDLLAILALLIACVLLKADAYLGVAGLPGLLVVRRQLTVRRIASATALVVVPVLAAAAVSRGLLQESPTVATYMQGYERQYPTVLWHLRSWWHVEGWLMAFGFYTVPVGVLGALLALRPQRWRLAVLLGVAVVPPMAFWFLRSGDSARHHIPEAFPVALGVGMALAALPFRRWLPGLCLVALLGANHLRYPATDDNFRPSGRVIESARRLRARVGGYHEMATVYAGAPGPRKALLGAIANPYVDSEVLLRAERVESMVRAPLLGFDAVQITYRQGGEERLSVSMRVKPEEAPAAARRLRDLGFTPYSIEYDLSGVEPSATPRLSTLGSD